MRKNLGDTDFKIDQSYNDKIDKFWDGSLKKDWHRIYSHVNGLKDVKYIPEDLFYTKLEPSLNNYGLALAYEDKNTYDEAIKTIKKPETVIKNKNGNYFDTNGSRLDSKEAIEIVEKYVGDLIIKPSLDSGGGRNVLLFNNSTVSDFKGLADEYKKDFIVQKKVTQGNILAKFHPNSLNTLRIMSYKNETGVHILSTVARFGNNESEVDNQASGGVSCGINSSGEFNDFAVDKNGTRYIEHPFTKERFIGNQVPNYDKIKNKIKELHHNLDYFKLISWDIALDDNDEPVLLELNLKMQEINFHQFNNGPLFKDFTYEVLSIMEQ